MTELHIRLKHCIQTILDLEPMLHAVSIDKPFEMELSSLRSCLDRVEMMSLVEDDVERFEAATANFLAELKLSRKNFSRPNCLLQ